VLACFVQIVTIADFSRYPAEMVPDGLTLATLERRTLDLRRGSSETPRKIFWERLNSWPRYFIHCDIISP
jgi:hypothetical protein